MQFTKLRNREFFLNHQTAILFNFHANQMAINYLLK